jgi:hypothetical protein
MDFFNDTGCPGALFRSELQPDKMYNSLIVRIRHRLLPDGQLERVADAEQPPDVRRQPAEDEYGLLEPDVFDVRSGTDLIVFGDAVAPDGPVTAMNVAVSAGPYDLTLRVFGDRVWETTLGKGLAPTPAKPFTRLPVTLRNAYGGASAGEYGPLPFSRNPDGKGYYLSKREAIGRPLPNVEDPAALICDWDDRPAPVGVVPYPSTWALRHEPCVRIDATTGKPIFTPTPGLHDRAHPRLSGQRLHAGEVVRIRGMSASPEVAFTLPPCPVEVRIRIHEKVHVRDPWLEEVLVDLRTDLVDLTYRKVFDYAFKPFQTRTTTLCWCTSPAA